MKIAISSKSVLISWAISYLLILLIPISIFIYGSFVTASTVRNEVSDANALILSSVQENIDAELALMKNAYTFVFPNSTFLSLRYSAVSDLTFRYNAAELLKILSAYSSSTHENIGITIYFQNKDYIISNKTANIVSTLYQAQLSIGMTMAEAEWRGLLMAKYNNEYFLATGLQIGSAAQCLVYCHTIHGIYEDINVFITLPDAVISDYSQNLKDRYLILANPDGTAISIFSENSALSTLDFTQPSGAAVVGSDGNSYVCTYRHSTQSNWIYVVITPEESYWSTLQRLVYLFIAAISIALVLGLATAWLLLKRNYRPLDRLTKILTGHVPHKNEFDLIQNSYTQLTDENTTMRNTLSIQTSQLRARYLLSCLKGRFNTLDESDIHTHYQIDDQGECFCLVAWAIGTPSNQVLQAYHDELEFESIQFFAIDNVFAEIMTDFPYDKIEDGHILMYLLHLNADQLERWNTGKLVLVNRIIDLFLNELDITLSVVISDSTEKFEKLRYLYSDAMDALEYQMIIGAAGVMLTKDYKTQIERVKPYQDEWMHELTCAVNNGDFAACEQIVNRVFQEYTQNTAKSFAIFHIALVNYLYSILNAYYLIISDNDLRHKLVSKMARLIAAQNVNELLESMTNLLHFACQTIQMQNKGSNSLLIQKVQEYIHQNYADSNINISSISERVERNPRYLSHVFHQQTGEGLLDYINGIRIKQAKQLMTNDRLSIEEISQRVGFTNVRTFRRAFFRVTGVQPSKYDQDSNE